MKKFAALLLAVLASFAFQSVLAATETVYFCTIKNGATWQENVADAVAAGWLDTQNHGTAATEGNYSYPARFNKGLSITSPTYTRPITSISVFARVSNLARTLEVIPYNAANTAGSTIIQSMPASGSGQLATVNFPDSTHKFNLTFTVSGSATAYAYYIIVNTAENQAPVWTSPFAPSVSASPIVVGRPVTLDLSGCVSDSNGSIASITYTDSDTLSGSVLNNTCSLTFPSAGAYTLTFTATDNEGASSTATLPLTVVANTAPTLTLDPESIAILEGQTASASISATDAEGDAVTLAMTADAPASASFDPTTGAFSWTPDAAGSYSVSFTATDSDGAASTATLAIAVAEASQNIPPVLEALPETLTLNVAQPGTATLSASDANNDTVTLAMTDAPAGASFDPATGVFSFTPAAAGSYTATFSADDGHGGIATFTLPITVTNAAPTLALALATEGPLVAGEPVTITLTATDLFAAPVLSSAVDFGSLGTPSTSTDSDTVTTSATWSFTPTAAGTYTLSCTATDASDPALATPSSLEFSVGLATPAVSVSDVTDTSAILSGDAILGATSYSVALTGAQVHETTFLLEDFSAITKSNNTAIANSLDANTLVPGWTGLNLYPKGGSIQIGKGDDPGMPSFLATPPLAALTGTKLHFSLRLVNFSKHVLTLVAQTVDATDTVRDTLTIGPFPVDSTKASWIDVSDEDIGLDVASGDRLRFSVIAAASSSPDTRFLFDDIEIFGTGLLDPTSTTQTFTALPATLTDLTPGTYYTATLTATDGTASSTAAPVTFTTTKSVEFTFGEPVENGVASITAKETLSFSVSASNDGTPVPVTFEMDTATEATPTFAEGTFSWTPADADAGTHVVTFNAGNSSAVVTLTVLARAALIAQMPTATVLDHRSFSLTWDTTQPRDTGTYGLRIWSGSSAMGSTSADQETFTAVPMFPENWSFSRAFETYNEESIRLKMDGSKNDWVISKLYPAPISSVKFSTKRYGSSTGSTLTLYGSTGDTENWVELGSIVASASSVTEHTFDNEVFAGKNIRRLKWAVTNRAGNFGFGRVIVGHAGAGTHWLLGSLETPATVTAAELPYLISNARPNTEYFVQLITNGDSGESLNSYYLRVLTPEAPKATVILIQ